MAEFGLAAQGKAPRHLVGGRRLPHLSGAVVDLGGTAAAALSVVVWAWIVMAEGPPASAVAQNRDSAGRSSIDAAVGPEWVYGGYGGIPYTHPSDVRFEKAGATDLTVHDVNWDGKPFKSPIYYGLRATRWGDGRLGGMLDFTHSKAISQKDQVIRFSGTRNGQPAPAPKTVESTFKHFEFSHGHNMLTLNGVARLGRIAPLLQPYVGAGAGVALPHTEIQFTDETKRTYEYQYTGPVGQLLAGLEIRLPRVSVFIEYKFSIARYVAPLTGRDSRHGWGFTDFPSQLMNYLRGEKPEFGWASTTLTSHQVIGGIGVRQSLAAPVP